MALYKEVWLEVMSHIDISSGMLKVCRKLSSTVQQGGSYDAVVIGGGHNGLVAVSSRADPACLAS